MLQKKYNSKDAEIKIIALIRKLSSNQSKRQIKDAASTIKRVREVDIDYAFSKLSKRIKYNQRQKNIIILFQRVAAILILPLLIGTIWFALQDKSSKIASVERTFSNPHGIHSQLTLPDGTIAWLNVQSSITYKEPFISKQRSVKIDGEVFFDVKENSEIPFVVDAGKLKINVLGTRFNVKAFKNEDHIAVVLEKGKISMETDAAGKTESFILSPGNRAVYNINTGKTTITNENIRKYVAWHQGKIVFEETPLSDVAKILERRFGVNVIIDDQSLLGIELTATFENETLSRVIELLEISTGLTFNYKPSVIGNNGIITERATVNIKR